MKKKFFLFTLLILSNVFLFAQNSQNLKTVKVGYALFKNYQEGAEGEYKRGFGYEYLQHISNLTGWKYEYVYGSFTDLLLKLERGEIDIMGNLTYSEERSKKMNFSSLPQGKESFYIFTYVNHPQIRNDSVASLNNKIIGVVDNSFQESLLTDFIKKNNIDCTVVEKKDYDDLLKDIESKKIDAIVLTDIAATSVLIPIHHIGSYNFYFGVSKYRDDILEELNYTLNLMQKTNMFFNDMIYTKYNRETFYNFFPTDKEIEWFKENNNTITLGYLENNLPYSDKINLNDVKGLFSVLIDVLENDFNIKIEKVPYKDSRKLEEDVINKKINLFGPIFNDYYLAENHNIINTESISSTTTVVLFKDDTAIKEDDKITIGRLKDSLIQQGLIEVYYPNATVITFNDEESCLNAILSKKIDCSIILSSEINFYRNYSQMQKINIKELPFSTDVCLGLTKESRQILNIVNKAISMSKTKLSGTALMDNSLGAYKITFKDFKEQNPLILNIILLVIIVLLTVFLIYFIALNNKIKKMKIKTKMLTQQAFRDDLTKVGNRNGYNEQKRKLQDRIDSKENFEFAILIADVNGLKVVNDSLGHISGDLLIKNASKIISRTFSHSPVFRIGGDEFCVVLIGEDFANKENLLSDLLEYSYEKDQTQSLELGFASFAYGLSVYNKDSDKTVSEVIKRADKEMYKCKKRMKGIN